MKYALVMVQTDEGIVAQPINLLQKEARLLSKTAQIILLQKEARLLSK
jgi:hypothetical protein